ncbi:MAG: hypothetical protein M1813_002978 [Trichoglossum hirsutum]|nr:MAG: hypothetical protein M1813_002978 [Trichoglossum hirsutum]
MADEHHESPADAPQPACSGFRLALDSFRKELTQEEINDFELTKFEDVRAVVADVQKKQGDRNGFQNMNRIRPFLDTLNQYTKVIEVFLNTSEIVAFVWGPIKFCLVIASNFTGAFDTLLDTYQRIGENLPLLSKIDETFHSQPFVQAVLVRVYENILNFHLRSIRFFKQNTRRIIWKLTLHDFQNMFKDVLEDLAHSRELLLESADIAHIRAAQDNRHLVKEHFEAQVKKEKMEQRKAVKHWISAISCADYHEELQKKRRKFPGTTRWVFKESAIQQWLYESEPPNQPLWLRGIPGAGKTILFSSIVDEIKRNPDGTAVAFFYCKYNDPSKSKYVEVVRSLIGQLLECHPDCLPYLYEQATTSGEQHLSSKGTIQSVIRTMTICCGRVFIGIDGLDECEPPEREYILSLVHGLLDSSCTDLRILLTSCLEKDIERSLQSAIILHIEPRHLESDLRSYVEARTLELSEKFEFDLEQSQNISTNVTRQLKGMFLLARLIMDNLLDQDNKEDVEQEVDILPSGITEAYGRILIRLKKIKNPKSQQRSKLILGMITAAKRPLLIHEIQGAMSIRLEDRSIEFENRRLRTHIKELCGPLVDVDSSGAVVLVHPTARAFLEQKHSGNFINSLEAESDMARLCMEYLMFDCFATGQNDSQRRDSVERGNYSLLEYAFSNWLPHVESCRAACENNDSDLIRLSNRLIHSRFQNLSTQFSAQARDTSEVSWGFLVPVRRACDDITTISQDGHRDPLPEMYQQLYQIRNLVEQVADDATMDSTFFTTAYGHFIYKCPFTHCPDFHRGFHSRKQRDTHYNGHIRQFKCTYYKCDYAVIGFPSKGDLSTHGILYHGDPEKGYGFLKAPRRIAPVWKALENAIDKDDFLTVRQLGAKVAALPDKKSGFISRAIKKGSLSAARVLVEVLGKTEEIGWKDKAGRTPLHLIAEAGDEELLSLILKMDVDINSKDKLGMGPLSIAASMGHLSTMRVLMQCDGLDLGVRDEFDHTPLFSAASAGQEKAVKLLLEKSPEIYLQRSHFFNSMTAAARKGHEKTVRLMLAIGGQIDAQGTYSKGLQAALGDEEEAVAYMMGRRTGAIGANGKTFGNALQAAARAGNKGRVTELLDNGANVNASDGSYGTALQAAAMGGHEELVQQLLGRGADVKIQGGEYGTALQAASYGGRAKIVEQLLEKGANVNVQGGSFYTALQAASYKGHTQVVGQLLEKGADANIQGGSYDTALQAASHGGYTQIIKQLLEKGADVDKLGGPYSTALQAASHKGHIQIIEQLLENGADANKPGAPYGTALHAASHGGHTQIVEKLLEKGANINELGEPYGTALHAASHEGHTQIVEKLLEKGANINKLGEPYGTALHAASHGGHTQIVEKLLEKGVDVNKPGGFYGTALQAASCGGHTEIVERLLEEGADVGIQTGNYSTALQAASFGGHGQIVERLLKERADVNIQGGYYNTALQAASFGGHDQIVERLLEEGADVDIRGGYYNTALQAASCGGHGQVVERLLEKGADFDIQGGYYNTALQAAACGGHGQIVERLLEEGADANIQGGPYGNAMAAAYICRHSEVGNLLRRAKTSQ